MNKTKGLFAATAALGIITLGSCKQDAVKPAEGVNINYPAAYVVNGESSSISVIKLSDNTVTATINLLTGDSSMIMWPHHISYHTGNNMNHLAIGVPGMDFSEGHMGGMEGMPGMFLTLNAATGELVKEVELPAMNHNAIYSPNGTEIWTSQMMDMGMVLVYDANNYTLKNSIEVGMMPAEVTFSADGSKAYVANGMDNTVTVINPSTKAVEATINVGENPVGAWVGKDGYMYVDNEDGKSISVINVAENKVMQTIDLGFMPGMAAHNATKNELWVSDPDNGKVHYWTWDAAMNMWMHGDAFNTGNGAHAIAFTKDGNTAYVTNQLSETVSVVDATAHTKKADITVGKKPNGIIVKE